MSFILFNPRFVPCIYVVNATLDLINAFSTIVLVSLALTTADTLQSSDISILSPARKWTLISAVLLQLTTYRISVFGNTVLSVARTLVVLFPFRRNTLRAALGSMGVYALYPCALSGIHISKLGEAGATQVENFIIAPLYSEGDAMLDLLGGEDANRETVEVMFSLVIPFCIPVCTCLLCAALMLWKLQTGSCPSGSSREKQRKVTVTILLLTVAFLVFNISSFLKFLVVNLGGVPFDSTELRLVMLYTFPLYNAIANPIILIVRSRDLRENLLKSIRRKSKNSKTHDQANTNSKT